MTLNAALADLVESREGGEDRWSIMYTEQLVTLSTAGMEGWAGHAS